MHDPAAYSIAARVPEDIVFVIARVICNGAQEAKSVRRCSDSEHACAADVHTVEVVTSVGDPGPGRGDIPDADEGETSRDRVASRIDAEVDHVILQGSGGGARGGSSQDDSPDLTGSVGRSQRNRMNEIALD